MALTEKEKRALFGSYQTAIDQRNAGYSPNQTTLTPGAESYNELIRQEEAARKAAYDNRISNAQKFNNLAAQYASLVDRLNNAASRYGADYGKQKSNYQSINRSRNEFSGISDEIEDMLAEIDASDLDIATKNEFATALIELGKATDSASLDARSRSAAYNNPATQRIMQQEDEKLFTAKQFENYERALQSLPNRLTTQALTNAPYEYSGLGSSAAQAKLKLAEMPEGNAKNAVGAWLEGPTGQAISDEAISKEIERLKAIDIDTAISTVQQTIDEKDAKVQTMSKYWDEQAWMNDENAEAPDYEEYQRELAELEKYQLILDRLYADKDAERASQYTVLDSEIKANFGHTYNPSRLFDRINESLYEDPYAGDAIDYGLDQYVEANMSDDVKTSSYPIAQRPEHYMTQEERDTYNTLYFREGEESANAYFERIKPVLEARGAQQVMAEAKQFTEDYPNWAWAQARGANAMKPITSAFMIGDILSGNGINENSAANLNTSVANFVDSYVPQVTNYTGDAQILGRDLDQFLYGTAGSVIDSGVRTLTASFLSGGGSGATLRENIKGLSRATGALMSLEVFPTVVLQEKEKGRSDTEAVVLGTLRAAIEGLTEKYSIEMLFSPSRNFGTQLLKGAVAEGSEEIAATVLNGAVDIIAGDKDNIIAEFERRVAMGINPSEALADILLERGKSTLVDGLSGALSGLLFTAGGGVGGAFNTTSKEANRVSESTESAQILVEQALAENPNSKVALNAQKQLAAGKNISAKTVQKLINENESIYRQDDQQKVTEAVIKELTNRGEATAVRETAAAIAKAVSGENLSDGELRSIEGSVFGTQIYNEITGKAEGGEWLNQLREDLDILKIAPQAKKQETRAKRVTVRNADATTKSGERVQILGLQAQDDGTVSVKVRGTNGAESVVAASELKMSEESQDLVEGVAEFKGAAPAVYAAYMPTNDVDIFLKDAAFVSTMAQSVAASNKNDGSAMLRYLKGSRLVSNLADVQIDTIFEATLAEAKKTLSSAQGKKTSGKGNFTWNVETRSEESLRGREATAVRFMRNLAAIYPDIDIEIFESDVKNGKYQGEQGSYRDGKIRIDLNAGKYSVDDQIESAMLRTLSHELTHHLQRAAPKQYAALKAFITEHLAEWNGGKELDDLISAKQRRSRGGLSYAAAMDEVVADACEMMLKNSKAVRQLAVENKGLVAKIKNFIKQFLSDLRRAFAGVEATDAAAKYLQKFESEMQQLWDAAFTASVQNAKTSTTKNAQKNNAPEGEVQYLVRDGTLTAETTEEQRYQILKNASVKLSEINTNAINDVDLEEYNTRKKSAVETGLKTLAKHLGILNVDLQNSEISFPFQFSVKSFRKSIHHQLEYGGSYQDYVKAMSCFNELIENAIPIEIHSEKKTGTVKENPDLKYTYVLVSAYRDGGSVMPVQFEVKEFRSRNNSLYMTVVLTKIDFEVLDAGVPKKNGDVPHLFSKSNISLRSIFENVNPRDGRFLKYVPDGFLNDAQKQAKQVALLKQSEEYAGYGKAQLSDRDYSYSALVGKPDMIVTGVSEIKNPDRTDTVNKALKNAASIGYTNARGNAVVHVDDINADVIVSKRSLVHGLDRRLSAQAPVLTKIGSVLKNSIRVNELVPRDQNASNTYVLIGAAKSENGIYIASFVVNHFSNEIAEIDVLYSANAKKESAAFLPKITDKSATPTDSTISIANLFDYVNRYFPDILPESVLRHYGHVERPAGTIGANALFSDRDYEAAEIARLEQRIKALEQGKSDAFLAGQMRTARQAGKETRRLEEKIDTLKGKLDAAKQTATDTRKATAAERKAADLRAKNLEAQIKKLTKEAEASGFLAGEMSVARQAGAEIRNREEQIRKLKAELADRKAAYRENISTYRVGRQKAAVIESIKRLETNLQNQLLGKGGKGAYVPVNLVNSAIGVARLLDTSGSPTYTRNGEVRESQTYKKYVSVKEALLDLQDQYNQLPKNPDPEYAQEYTSEFASMLTELRNAIGDKNVHDMTLDQLQDVYSILRQLTYTLIDAKKQIGKMDARTNYEIGTEIMDEMKAVQGKDGSVFRQMGHTMNLNVTSPLRNINRMTGYIENSALVELFSDINDGIKRQNAFRMDANKMFDDLRAGDLADVYATACNKLVEFDILDEDGKKVQMTMMQAMQLLLSYEREASNEKLHHLERGGAIIPDHRLLQKGKLSDATLKGTVIPTFTPEDAQKIRDAVKAYHDAYGTRFVEVSRQFFNSLAKEAINDTTMNTHHRPVATDKNYIPFSVDQGTVSKELEGLKYDSTIEGSGILKSVKPQASNPLVIVGLNHVIDRHIEDVARIYGLSIPIRNFNKVWNVKAIGSNMTTKKAVGYAWGAEGQKMIEQAITDLQASREKPSDIVSKALNAMQSNFVKATLLSNISVTIKQAASYSVAGLHLSQRALAPYQTTVVRLFANPEGKFAQDLFDEIDTYTPEHWIRRQGMSTQELGDLAQRQGKLVEFERKIPTALNPVKWIQNMDVATTAALWLACKKQVQLDGNTKVGTDAYWTAVTELYERVIEETQPMYDVLHRPEVQKTTNALVRNVVMFKTQPLQNSGVLFDTYGEMVAARKGNDKGRAKAATQKFGRAVFSQVASLAVFSTMSLLAYAVKHKIGRYRDDDDELTAGSVLWRMVQDMMSSAAGLLLPVGGTELYDFIDRRIGGSSFGDSISVPTVQILNEFLDASGKMIDVFTKEDAEGWENALWEFAERTAAITAGLPIQNVANIIDGIRLSIKDIQKGAFPVFNNTNVDRENSTNYDRLWNAIVDGDAAKYGEVYDEVYTNLTTKDEKTARDARADIASGITERVKEAFYAGEIDEAAASKYLSEYGGKNSDEISSMILKWKLKVETGMDYDDLSDEFVKGEISADEFKNFLMNYGGAKEEDAEATVQRALMEKEVGIAYDDMKDEFLDGKLSDADVRNYLAKYGGKGETAIDKTLSEWSFEKAHDIAYGDMKQAFLDGEISRSEAVVYRMEYGGAKEADAEATVTAWEFEKKYGYAYDDMRSEFVAGRLSEENAIAYRVEYGGQTEKEAAKTVSEWKLEKEAGVEYDDIRSAFVSGDITAEQAVEYRTQFGGQTKKDAQADVQKWQMEIDTGIVYDDMKEAFLAGDVTDEEVISYRTTYGGQTTKEAEATLAEWKFEQATGLPQSELKGAFVDGEFTADEAEDMLVDYAGKSRKDAEADVAKWQMEVDTGYSYSDINTLYLEGDITKSDFISYQQKYGGKTTEEAQAAADKIEFEIQNGWAYDDKDILYKDGEITKSEVKSALTGYGGMTDAEAESAIAVWDYQKSNPDTALNSDQIAQYIRPIEDLGYSVKDAGISDGTFYTYKNNTKGIKGVDADGDGKADSGSKKSQILVAINNLPISSDQKDVLYYLNGWAASKIWEAPWH